MFNKSKAKEMQEYLNKRKQTKPMKAYKKAAQLGEGYQAIEMQKSMKKK